MNVHSDGTTATASGSNVIEHRRVSAFLCRISGADLRTLALGPVEDSSAYSTFGVLLLIGFMWITLTTSLGLSTAFGGNIVANIVCSFAGGLIGIVLIGFDRLAIIGDAIAEGELALGLDTAHPSWIWAKRLFFVLVRVAIALTMATVTTDMAALWMNRTAVQQQLIRDHYNENSSIYDAIGAQTELIDVEIAARKRTVENLSSQITALTETLKTLRNEGTAAQDDVEIDQLTERLKTLRERETVLIDDVELYADTMECELSGERCREGDTGQSGDGTKWALAKSRRDRTATSLEAVRNEITDVEQRLNTRLADLASMRDSDEERVSIKIESDGDELATAQRMHGEALEEFNTAVEARDDRIAAFTKSLMERPGFVPLMTGIFEQQDALWKVLETSPTAAGKLTTMKFAIIGIELMAILAKLLMSPRTEYALRRAAQYHIRRMELRAEFNEAEAAAKRRRRQHETEQKAEERTRRARDAAERAWRTVDERFDERLDELLRKSSYRKKGDQDHEST